MFFAGEDAADAVSFEFRIGVGHPQARTQELDLTSERACKLHVNGALKRFSVA